MGELLTLEHDEPEFAIASAGVVVVTVWGRDARAEDLARLSAIQRGVVSSHGRCAVVTVIRAGLSLSVDPSVREASAASMREFEGRCLGVTLVVEAGGLRAAFFRSVIAGVQMVSRSSLPQNVHSTIEAGVEWVLGLPGVDCELEVSALAPAIRGLADRYGMAGYVPTNNC